MSNKVEKSITDRDLVDGGVLQGGAGAADLLNAAEVTQGLFIDLDDANGPGVAVDEGGAIRNVGAFGGGDEDFKLELVDFEDVIGTDQDDVIFGNAQDNVLQAGDGDDRIHAFGGDDTYDGGDGVDTALFNQAVHGVVANLATGRVTAGEDHNRLIDIENLNGGAFDDRIRGDDEANVLNGLGGDDIVRGRGGDDVISGGEGDDTLRGNEGEDDISGGAGEDRLNGGDDDDVLSGGADADLVRGGLGDDVLQGDAGDDFIAGGKGDDVVIHNEGDGSDQVRGNLGDDRQIVNLSDESATGDVVEVSRAGGRIEVERANLDAFTLTLGGVETIELNGQAGDDSFRLTGDIFDRVGVEIDGGANADSGAATDNADAITSGDTLDLSQLDEAVRVDLDVNNQGLLNPEGLAALFPEVEGVAPGEHTEFGRLSVGDADFRLIDVENLIGTDFSDVLFGNIESNVILGGDGNDNIHPFGGVDFVDGGAGVDVINLSGAGGLTIDLATGVAGPNTFINIENVLGSVNGDDVIFGDDRDDIDQGQTFLFNNVETALNGNDLSGRGGADVLFGGAGDDSLRGDDGSGAAGDDALTGGAGVDLLFGGGGADSFGFVSGDGADVVADFTIEEDVLVFDAESFGVDGGLAFQNVARAGGANDDPDAALAGVLEGQNVYVLQGEFTGNAGGAQDALAEALAGGADEGAGFFVYFNTGQNINRVFHVEDLDDADAAFTLVANLGESAPGASDAEAGAVRDALADFEADTFSFGFDDVFNVA